MANFVTIFRVFLMFIAVYLIMACTTSQTAYIWALVLTILAFALDTAALTVSVTELFIALFIYQ